MKNLPRRRDGHVSRVPHTCSDIGRSSAALRSLRGMNQTALAAAAGIPGSAVSDYERAKTMPELSTLTRMLAALGCDLTHLYAMVEFLQAIDRRDPIEPADDDYDPAAHRLASRFADTAYETLYQLLQRPRQSDFLGHLESARRSHAAAPAPARPGRQQDGRESPETPRS
jgi:transcriptional regulator with XRE-family HTH domain